MGGAYPRPFFLKGIFMKRGWAKDKPLIVTKEAILEKRSEDARRHAKKMSKLQEEIAKLEAEKKNLSSELREKRAEANQEISKQREELKKLEQETRRKRGDLLLEIKAFKKEQQKFESYKEAELEKLKEKHLNLRGREDSLLNDNTRLRQAYDKLEAEKEKLVKRDNEIVYKHGVLAEREQKIEAMRKEYEQLVAKLEKDRQDLRAEEQVVKTERELLAIQKADILRSKDEALNTKEAAERAISNLEDEKQNIKEMLARNESFVRGAKAVERKNVEKEKALREWEGELAKEKERLEKAYRKLNLTI